MESSKSGEEDTTQKTRDIIQKFNLENKLLPIESLPKSIAKDIKVVFTDIDDTVSSDGKILPCAYQALWDLHNSGIDVVPITGRCGGWVDHIGRMWPVKGVIGENGAFYVYNDEKGRLKKRYYLREEERDIGKEKFKLIEKEVFEKFPSCKVATDQIYREFDLAIDFCEDVPRLSMEEVKQIVQIYEKHGAVVKISSIHVNGWFGDYDKLAMANLFAKEILGFDIQTNPHKCIFSGDSPNDQPMFQFFHNSVGVNNLINFISLIQHPPTYLTHSPGGVGFAEFVNHFLKIK